MPFKGDQTRRKIVCNALQLFSVKGYYHTSISDILKATRLTKGGLYGHFNSKEAIWYAVYDEAVHVWRGIVFAGVRGIRDPLERIEIVCRRVLLQYLAGDVFEGGCFFVNMLVELAGQSPAMSRHILKGFVGFARLLRSWLLEAQSQRMIDGRLNAKEMANFIVIALNGAATLYSASRDAEVLRQTAAQLSAYIDLLRR